MSTAPRVQFSDAELKQFEKIDHLIRQIPDHGLEEERWTKAIALGAKFQDHNAFTLTTAEKIKLDTVFKDLLSQYRLPEPPPARRPNDPEHEIVTEFKEQYKLTGDARHAYGFSDKSGLFGNSSHILDHWGWWPTFGLGAVVAISKELFILNEEVVVAAAFTGMITTLIVTQGPALVDYFNKRSASVRHELEIRYDMWIDIIKLIIKNHQSYLSLAEEAKEFQRAHLALSKQRQLANVRSRRLRLLQNFEKKLQEFQFNEDARLDNVVQSQVNDAMRFANETVQKDAKLRSSFVDSALASLATLGQTGTESSDPLFRVFQDHFSRFATNCKSLSAALQEARASCTTGAQYLAFAEKFKSNPFIYEKLQEVAAEISELSQNKAARLSVALINGLRLRSQLGLSVADFERLVNEKGAAFAALSAGDKATVSALKLADIEGLRQWANEDAQHFDSLTAEELATLVKDIQQPAQQPLAYF